MEGPGDLAVDGSARPPGGRDARPRPGAAAPRPAPRAARGPRAAQATGEGQALIGAGVRPNWSATPRGTTSTALLAPSIRCSAEEVSETSPSGASARESITS